MGIAVIYAAYLAVSIGLTVVVASALSRSGRVLLARLFGGDEGMAGAVNRMLVVGFYLLSLGYVALTVRTSGRISGTGQAIGVLSAKVGEELLVLGALYLLNIILLARFRSRQDPRRPDPRSQDARRQGGYRPAAGAAGLSAGPARAGSRPPEEAATDPARCAAEPAEDPARWATEPAEDPARSATEPAEDLARSATEPVAGPAGPDVPGPRPAARGLVSPGQAVR
jgi:hypothetical protein